VSIKKKIRQLLHGEPLSDAQLEMHEEAGEGFHVPAVVHRTGGVSARKLNSCGICGAQIKPGQSGGWVAVTETEADEIRRNR
jgi:hypothetical protein